MKMAEGCFDLMHQNRPMGRRSNGLWESKQPHAGTLFGSAERCDESVFQHADCCGRETDPARERWIAIPHRIRRPVGKHTTASHAGTMFGA